MITPEFDTTPQTIQTSPFTKEGVAAPETKNESKFFSKNLAFVIIGLVFMVSWYFYSPQITSFSNSLVSSFTELTVSAKELSINFWNSWVNNFKNIFGANKTPDNSVLPQNNTAVSPQNNILSVKDCGTTISPDLQKSGSYQDNKVLSCLGNSALSCENAQAVLTNALFPTIVQIVQDKNTGACDFRLSYEKDSALVDISGKKLALQYISCPLSIVKAIDETKNPPLFDTPSTNNLSKYASQIYFYGTLGIFVETNLDQNKIQSLGCSGSYIDSVVASYRKMQSKR